MKRKRVLVTGGAGFVGSHLVPRLLKQKRDVVVLDLKPSSHAGVEYVRGDIRNGALVKKTVKDVDSVFHLASLVPQSGVEQKEFHDVIVGGTMNVLQACQESGVKLVHVSSSGVYGANREGVMKEDAEKKPFGAYGTAKWDAELQCVEYAKKGTRVVIVRPMAIIGPGVYGVFRKFLHLVYKGYPLVVFGDGANKIQLVSTADCVDALLLAEKYPHAGETFNLGSERLPSVREEFQALIAHAHSKSRVISLPVPVARNMFRVLHALRLSPVTPEQYNMLDKNSILDITKAKTLLQWKPKMDNSAMMKEAYDWYIKSVAI